MPCKPIIRGDGSVLLLELIIVDNDNILLGE